MTKPESMHHYLICAEILFQLPEEEGIRAVKVNGVLVTEHNRIGSPQLGKAQEIAQLHFRQSMPDPKVEIMDVVLLNMSYLGQMTEEQFMQRPVVRASAPTIAAVPDLDQVANGANKSGD